MKQGFLRAGHVIAFNKTRDKHSLRPQTGDDVMIAQTVFGGSDFDGWICKKCGLVTFDYIKVMHN